MGTNQFQLAEHLGQTLIMDIIGTVDDHLSTMVALSRVVVVEVAEEYDDVRLEATAFPPHGTIDGMTLIGAVGTKISNGKEQPQLVAPTPAQTQAALAMSARLHHRHRPAA